MLRLAADDKTREGIDVNSPESENNSTASPPAESIAADLGIGKRRKNRKSAAGADEIEMTVDAQSADPADPVDGPVQDSAEEETVDASPENPVDLRVLEALVFSTHHPLTAQRLAELMEVPGQSPLRKAIKALNLAYEETGRSFRIEQVAGGYQMLTLPEFGDALKRLHQKEIDTKLTKSAVETLAIIAYKQPVLRADVEAIRGVMCGETIRSLMEKHLVRIGGRAELPGRPILYGTTRRFLELFGLNTLKDLPQAEELQPPK